MKNAYRSGLAAFAVLIVGTAFWSAGAADAKPEVKTSAGRVLAVYDGDTFLMSVKGKKQEVRLYGIDAPESDQPWGTEAKRALYAKIFKKVVSVEWEERDQYKRIVGVVRLGDENVNEWMISEGNAWWYKHFAKKEVKWGELEKAAKAAKKGLWSKAGPVNPYEWRKVRKQDK